MFLFTVFNNIKFIMTIMTTEDIECLGFSKVLE